MAPATPASPLRGDEADLFERFNEKLVNATRYSVRAPDAVIEDACANAWLQLVRCQPRRDTVFPWLKRVAQREAWRLCSREQREAPLADECVLAGPDLELAIEAHTLAPGVLAAPTPRS